MQEKAHQQGVDLQDQVAARGFVAKNLDEIDAAATRKAVGTAGTDAALNVLTMGAAGLSGRGIVNEARALAKAVDDGVVSAADATAALARLEAANAARNTVGQKALRGGAVVGTEMTGEGISEAVGQKYAYGEVDPGQVIDEALLGLGQGGAMALGGKAFRKAAGLPDNDDAATRSLDDVHSALAKNAGLQQDGAPNDGDSGGGGVDAQAGNPAFDSTNAPAPFINQGVMDVNGLGPRPPEPVLDTQRLDALLEPQRPSQAMGLRTGPDAGPAQSGVFKHCNQLGVVQLAPGANLGPLRFQAHPFVCLSLGTDSDVTDGFLHFATPALAACLGMRVSISIQATRINRPASGQRHAIEAPHLGQLGVQLLGQLPQLRPVPALPGVA